VRVPMGVSVRRGGWAGGGGEIARVRVSGLPIYLCVCVCGFVVWCVCRLCPPFVYVFCSHIREAIKQPPKDDALPSRVVDPERILRAAYTSH